MAHCDLSIPKGVNTTSRENSNFPLVCETCLGDNPYMRMIKYSAGKECKICRRPYTSFRWQPGRKARHKVTIVCQICAKLKNVCQVCLFDLEYGLPVEVRDKFLDDSQRLELPESEVNRDYAIQNLSEDALNKAKFLEPHAMLLKLARTQPYYKRNRSRICTFWEKGECNRGDSCPYRHETADDCDPNLAEQNIKNRFMGHDDPLGKKILSTINFSQSSHDNKSTPNNASN